MRQINRSQATTSHRRLERSVASLERTIKTLEPKLEGSRGWSLERIGIAVAIAVGIGSTIATALAASYAGMQADLSRQALSSIERDGASQIMSRP
ncbi:hypothetical protein ASD00_26845 [Ensifer sp. Root31]|nr:hypothetical protein ASD00_26845 [Ensifer sp. Root31]